MKVLLALVPDLRVVILLVPKTLAVIVKEVLSDIVPVPVALQEVVQLPVQKVVTLVLTGAGFLFKKSCSVSPQCILIVQPFKPFCARKMQFFLVKILQ